MAILNYDNDGNPDIFLLNGGTINAMEGKEKMPHSALYHNLGNWKFEDVTEKAGVANERWGMGVTVGDFDNDGFPDIFVNNYGVARLYRNNANGTFIDVAEKVGLNITGWNTGATFGDYDRDGRLDLLVPAYEDFDLAKLPISPADAGKDGNAAVIFASFAVSQLCADRADLRVPETNFFTKSRTVLLKTFRRNPAYRTKENITGSLPFLSTLMTMATRIF